MTFVGAWLETLKLCVLGSCQAGGTRSGPATVPPGPGASSRRAGTEEVQRGKVATLSHEPLGPSRGLWEGGEGLGWGVGRSLGEKQAKLALSQ